MFPRAIMLFKICKASLLELYQLYYPLEILPEALDAIVQLHYGRE